MATGNAPLIRVLIVDDSAVIRSIIRSALATDPQIEVVGMAADGAEALTKIAQLRPDVVTLDVEMPRMNGLAVLDRAAGKVPVSFLMVSTLTQAGAQITFDALRKGAVDYITKPQSAAKAALPDFRDELLVKVRAAARCKGRVRRLLQEAGGSTAPTLPPNKVRGWVVAIGISCGGPQTLYEMLPAFPSDFVPILITQHMPAAFTGTFARHLDQRCAMRVKEAEHNEPLADGTIYIAPGSHHLRLVRRGVQLLTALDEGPPVSGHRPSVDVMLESVARVCGARAVGVIMTGMGRDGATGLGLVRDAGGVTIAQDETTSFVYGMPKAAAQTGKVQQIVPLPRIPQAIAEALQGRRLVAGGV